MLILFWNKSCPGMLFINQKFISFKQYNTLMLFLVFKMITVYVPVAIYNNNMQLITES